MRGAGGRTFDGVPTPGRLRIRQFSFSWDLQGGAAPSFHSPVDENKVLHVEVDVEG